MLMNFSGQWHRAHNIRALTPRGFHNLPNRSIYDFGVVSPHLDSQTCARLLYIFFLLFLGGLCGHELYPVRNLCKSVSSYDRRQFIPLDPKFLTEFTSYMRAERFLGCNGINFLSRVAFLRYLGKFLTGGMRAFATIPTPRRLGIGIINFISEF